MIAITRPSTPKEKGGGGGGGGGEQNSSCVDATAGLHVYWKRERGGEVEVGCHCFFVLFCFRGC